MSAPQKIINPKKSTNNSMSSYKVFTIIAIKGHHDECRRPECENRKRQHGWEHRDRVKEMTVEKGC